VFTERRTNAHAAVCRGDALTLSLPGRVTAPRRQWCRATSVDKSGRRRRRRVVVVVARNLSRLTVSSSSAGVFDCRLKRDRRRAVVVNAAACVVKRDLTPYYFKSSL